jgi:hypothetical protein
MRPCSEPVREHESKEVKVTPSIPERNKKPGVCYAVTDEGVELPVIDVTNPIFAESPSQRKLTALTQDFLHFQKMPLFFRRFLARRSLTMRGMRSASKGFLGGMTTYVAKLPPEALGKGYAGYMDRKVAGGIGSVSFRMRLGEMCRSMADELAPALAVRKGVPVHLFNIGGGPAMDSLNALILIKRENGDLLNGRQIFIHVLDLDEAGPRFGGHALSSLTAEGCPLDCLDITFDHVTYDWARTSQLYEAVAQIRGDNIAICSSEGALFEYGSNDAIAQNLKSLKEAVPACIAVVGSIVRNNNIFRAIEKMSTLSFRTFELEKFRTLAESVGWTIGRVTEGNPIYWIVSLRKE